MSSSVEGEYAVVIQSLPNAEFKCRLLQRDLFPTCVCGLNHTQKHRIHLEPGNILRVDASDYDRSERGVGEILEVIEDHREIKKLRKAKLIPEEEDMPKVHTKEHYHTKKDKQRHGARVEGTDEGVEERNRDAALSQQQAPNFGDEDDDLDGAAEEHEERHEDDEAGGGKKRLSKAEKRAQKHEAKEIVEDDKLMKKILASADSGHDNLEDL